MVMVETSLQSTWTGSSHGVLQNLLGGTNKRNIYNQIPLEKLNHDFNYLEAKIWWVQSSFDWLLKWHFSYWFKVAAGNKTKSEEMKK